MMFINFLKKAGQFIMSGFRKAIGFISSHKVSLLETGKVVGAIGTIVSTVVMIFKTARDMFRMHRQDKSGVKAEQARYQEGKCYTTANGVVYNGKSRKNKKRKTETERWNEEIENHSGLNATLSKKERKRLRKEKDAAKAQGDPNAPKCYVAWRNEFATYPLDYLEWLEIREYCTSQNMLRGADERSDTLFEARNNILAEMAEQIKATYPNGVKSLNITNASCTKEVWPYLAAKARSQFDSQVEFLVSSNQKDMEHQVNPLLGASKKVSANQSPLIEAPKSDEVYELSTNDPDPYGINQYYSWMSDGTLRIRNIYLPDFSKLAPFYTKDPDDGSMGNEEEFVSIKYWTLGQEHKYACPDEIEAGYDFCELEGKRHHPDVTDIHQARTDLGPEWMNSNLESAHVFNDIVFQRPWIFAGHPDFPSFWTQFRRCYWDLVRFVPGLGDYGIVLAHPYTGTAEDIANMRMEYENSELFVAKFGYKNPPTPEKVFYEILKFGALQINSRIDHIKRNCPNIKFEKKSWTNIIDLCHLATITAEVQDKKLFSDKETIFTMVELNRTYGFNFPIDQILGDGEDDDVDDWDDDSDMEFDEEDELLELLS